MKIKTGATHFLVWPLFLRPKENGMDDIARMKKDFAGVDIHQLRKELGDKNMGMKPFTKEPVCMQCFDCGEHSGWTRKVEMFICSAEYLAKECDIVIWKCKECKKSKAEKVDKGDGARFYHIAEKLGFVWREG